MRTTTYVSESTQTFWDVVLMQYGSLDGIKSVMVTNPEILLADGRLKQYSQSHVIDTDAVVVPLIKAEMQKIVPCSEGNPKGGQAWIQDNGTAWDDPYWETESEID